MSLASYMADQLEAQAERWARAIETLPDRDLHQQRAELLQRAGGVGVTPAALVLKAVDAEIARRQERGRV